MNRQCGLYNKTKTVLKNNLIAFFDQTYPGVNDFFSSPAREDGTQKWVDFASSFWYVYCVSSVSQTAFTERYRKFCKRHGYCFQADKAVQIHFASKDLIAMLPKDSFIKLLIKNAPLDDTVFCFMDKKRAPLASLTLLHDRRGK